MTPSPSASGFRPDIAVTTLSEDVDALVDNLRRAIELSDRGQPCVCSSSSPCYMHAEIQRGLSSLHKLAFLARRYEATTPPGSPLSLERRLEAARTGLWAAIGHAEALRMDTPEDERARREYLAVLRLAEKASR